MPQQNSNQNSLLLELSHRTNKAIFIYNPASSEFQFTNAAFEELFNKAMETFCSNPAMIWESIHEEDRGYVSENFHKVLNGEVRNVELEFRITLPNDQLKWILVSAYCISDDNSASFVAGFAEDISVIKENLGNAKKFAAKKDSVLEILSHDLAGPLSNIAAISELLNEYGKDLNDPEFNKMVGIITKTSERSIRMIREFVKQEFLESSNTEVIRKRVDLVKVIREVIEQYKSSEQDINKIFRLTCSHEKLFIEIDDYKFSQVINNLISNSIKFTHDGGEIELVLEAKEERVLITVADDGIGIPKIQQEELFEKFTKARRPGLKGEPSVGLGMSIIKTIVEWHNGKIWFESEVDKGTTFFIELPR